MKRALCMLALLFALCALVPAAEEHGVKDEMLGWKWANFALLAAGLGYLLAKHLPPFFRSRTDEIRKGIEEAGRLKADADVKAAEVERKLVGIGADIEGLRAQLKADMNVESERIRQETERAAKRMLDQTEQEIAFLTKAARHELKALSASLALDLAKQRIQGRMDGDTQRGLVDSFVHDLGHAQQAGTRQGAPQ